MAKYSLNIAVSVLHWIQKKYNKQKERTCHVSKKLLVRCLHA